MHKYKSQLFCNFVKVVVAIEAVEKNNQPYNFSGCSDPMLFRLELVTSASIILPPPFKYCYSTSELCAGQVSLYCKQLES